MLTVPVGFVPRSLIDGAIQDIRRNLGPDVVHLAYSLGPDWTDEPSVFFRIVLADPAAKGARLAESTGRVAAKLSDELRPYENWGLHPYFSFRSETEHRNQPDAEWS